MKAVVLEIFEDAFSGTDVDMRSDFFELGGDSLLAAEICSRLEDATGQPVALTLVFEHSTPETLATALMASRVGLTEI